jgi:hypothetical protein
MGTRHTNKDMFSLGTWAGTTETALNTAIDAGGPDTVALTAFAAYLADVKANGNFGALEALRRHWDAAERTGGGTEFTEPAKG